MRLTLSTRHPRNCTYSNESGHVLYKVNKPLRLGPGIVTIRKAVHTVNGVWLGDSAPSASRDSGDQDRSSWGHSNDDPTGDDDRASIVSNDDRFRDSDSDSDEGEPSTGVLPTLEGHFAFLAQVEFHTFHSTRFRFDGQDIPASSYFRKQGWSYYGRGRVFKATNGKEYRWQMRAWSLELITNDEQKLKVVRFHPYHLGLGPLLKRKSPYLEIDPSCKDILDEIIMTFVYVHKMRKDKKRAAQNSGGGGALMYQLLLSWL